jgi:DNA-binding CsgD family transcriptional regulator
MVSGQIRRHALRHSGESDDMRMRWRHGPRAGSEGRHRAIVDVIAGSMSCAGINSGCWLIGVGVRRYPSSRNVGLERIALGTWAINKTSLVRMSALSWQSLSAVEQEVAILASAGWPYSAVGVRRGTATKTTDAHMSSIFQNW